MFVSEAGETFAIPFTKEVHVGRRIHSQGALLKQFSKISFQPSLFSLTKMKIKL